MHSRTGSSQGSRENSSSRVAQNAQNRGMMSSSMQKSASHSKYTQPTPASRLSNKVRIYIHYYSFDPQFFP